MNFSVLKTYGCVFSGRWKIMNYEWQYISIKDILVLFLNVWNKIKIPGSFSGQFRRLQ